MTSQDETRGPSQESLDYLRINHPGSPACTWSAFGNACLLTAAHPVPHLVSIEAAQIPSKRSNEARSEAGEEA